MKYMLVFILLFVLVTPLAAQDVIQAEYDEIQQVPVTADGDQHFVQFNGKADDIVYVMASFEDLAIGAEIDIDLRDFVGRSIGFKEEYSFEPFIIATLPEDGTYTAVFTYRNPDDEENAINLIIGKSFQVTEAPSTVSLSTDGFPVMMGVLVDEPGQYTISFERIDGQMPTSFRVRNYSAFISEDVLIVSGSQNSQWLARVELDPANRYVAVVEPNLFSGRNTNATITINMIRVEDE